MLLHLETEAKIEFYRDNNSLKYQRNLQISCLLNKNSELVSSKIQTLNPELLLHGQTELYDKKLFDYSLTLRINTLTN